ncbi:ComEC family competence protein [Patescibacteria group bacterium]|nr:ComEC family competence protein [Patescibacteria group bacterium]
MLLPLISGFIFGIFIGSILPINFGFFIILFSLLIIIIIYRYFIEDKNKLVLTFILLTLVGFIGGAGRIYFSDLYTSSHLDNYIGQKITAEGIIVDEPDIRDSNTKLTISLRNIFLATSSIAVSEKILVTVPLYPEYSYGDKVKLNIILSEPKQIETDGRVFDYKGYLRVRGIWYTSRFTTISLLSTGHGSIIKNNLFKIKHAFTHSLDKALPQPESSLMAGLLLGTKQSLGKELLLEFQRAGASHVVVLSGYNIAIVAESIMALLKFLPKTLSFGIGTLSIILFTILSGGGASAWRAAIMVLVALFAKKTNRDYKASRALGFAILLMLAPNPLLLAFDPSFQLSILATIGLIFVSPLVSPYLIKVTERFGLREVMASTIATQIVVLPFLIYNTGLISFVSLPVNVLILGTIPLTMLLGFITGMVGLVSLYLSYIPAIFAYALLWYQLKIVHLGAILPFGAIKIPAFSQLILVIIYSIIFIILFRLRKIK